MIIGFKFRGEHSYDFNIGVRSDDRTLLPGRETNEYTIPGRDGTVFYNGGDYKPRVITVRLALIRNSWEDLRKTARDVARWLSGTGVLVFDDEQGISYNAIVKNGVGMEQIQNLPIGEVVIAFECQPFAESEDYQQIFGTATAKLYNLTLDNKGTAPSGCIITIKNLGTTDINSIIITRRAEIT